MNKESEHRIPNELIPHRDEHSYDLDKTLSSIVTVKTSIPKDAFTASILGTERSGHGVLIQGDGLILTIGYLIAEAQDIWLITAEGKPVAGHVVGYDYDSGFGLVQALGELKLPISEIATSRIESSSKKVVLAGCGGVSEAVQVSIFERKEFAGYWEYVLDDAIYTTPAHPSWGGAALFDSQGDLAGIGSLYVDNFSPRQPDYQGNMCVPIELLTPILSEVCQYGKKLGPCRPWLGFFVSIVDGQFLIVGAYPDGPAALAGLRIGDSIEKVGDVTPLNLGSFFKSIWKIGPAGSKVPLTIRRGTSRFEIIVKSVDRMSLWVSPQLH